MLAKVMKTVLEDSFLGFQRSSSESHFRNDMVSCNFVQVCSFKMFLLSSMIQLNMTYYFFIERCKFLFKVYVNYGPFISRTPCRLTSFSFTFHILALETHKSVAFKYFNLLISLNSSLTPILSHF